MSIGISTSRSYLNEAISASRQRSDDLQRQLATGLKAETYGELGIESRQLVEFNSDLSQLDGYLRSIDQAKIKIDVLNATLTQVWDSVSTTRSDSLSTNFDLDTDGQTLFQAQASARLDELVSVLNTQAGGVYIYSGADVTQKPVLSSDEIINGSGAKAGFQQIANERLQADQGASLKGRVDVTQPSATTVQLAEDGVHDFGFKFNSANNLLGGVTVNGPTGNPAVIDIDAGANTVAAGETLTIGLTLPDGTLRDITLTATAGAPAENGEFQVGATAADTAANITAAVNAELTRLGDVELRAASRFAAADDFFNIDAGTVPQRVDGPPFDSATGVVNATDADTVFWYQGDLTSDPRGSRTVKVDDYINAEYGVAGNEEAFRDAIKNYAVASLDSYSPTGTNDRAQYDAIRTRVTDNLASTSGKQTLENIIVDVSAAEAVLGRSQERHEGQVNLLQQLVDDVQNADIYEISAQLLDIQTRLQATYSTISIMSDLSLTNYI